MRRSLAIGGALAIVSLTARHAVAEDLDAPDPGEEKESGKGYEYDHEYFTLRLGGGLLIDYAHYEQDADSERQMSLEPESGIRDLRGLVSGRLFSKRLNYTLGYMLDVNANEWKFRQTGVIVRLPELGGFLFLGRTKEGFSTNKFMVGYYGWFNERAAANDAFLPILADGARWTAAAFGGKLLYNVGAFADNLSDKESFNKNDWQFAARAVWLPLARGVETVTDETVVHLAVEARYAGANDGLLQYRSKPESFLAQSQAVDTGKFAASRSGMLGVEAYVQNGPFAAGLEYFFNQVSSDETGDPFFHGGELFAAYLLTGETHPYKPQAGGVFGEVVPAKTFFSGGPGAWELALRCSYVNLDSEGVRGGRFLRGTAQVNWYLTRNLRFEALYGYARLDRQVVEGGTVDLPIEVGVQGGTHFIQTRVQVQFK